MPLNAWAQGRADQLAKERAELKALIAELDRHSKGDFNECNICRLSWPCDGMRAWEALSLLALNHEDCWKAWSVVESLPTGLEDCLDDSDYEEQGLVPPGERDED